MKLFIHEVQAAPGSPDDIKNPFFGNALSTIMANEGGSGFIARLVSTLVTLFFIVGTTIFVFMFLIGAIKWIAAGGDKSQTESARSTLTNALVGLILLAATLAITALIETVLGINILQIDLTKLFINA